MWRTLFAIAQPNKSFERTPRRSTSVKLARFLPRYVLRRAAAQFRRWATSNRMVRRKKIKCFIFVWCACQFAGTPSYFSKEVSE